MKNLKLAIILCISSVAFGQTANTGYVDLEPTSSQTQIEQVATQFLNNSHYQKFTIDDSLSSKVFKNYLNEIDGSRVFFTRADIDEFEKYRYQMDEVILNGNLEIPFKIFNRYRKIYQQRYGFVAAYLAKPINYESDKTFQVSDEELEWAISQTTLDEEWEKLLLNQAINLKLTGKSDSAVSSTLKKRYERYESRVSKWRSEDVFQSFMNALTEAIDPHTSYMIPSTATQFNIEMSQSLEGIGARLQNEDDYVMIIDVIPGGPLFKTQAAAKDDYILAVAQGDEGEFQDIVGWLTDDAVKLIRGKKGTVVRLLLKAKNAPMDSQPRELRIVREKIKLEEAVATSRIFQAKGADNQEYKVGVVDIPMFYRDFDGARAGADFQSTTKDVKKFLEDFKEKKVEGVIIDLRNNGGGSLTEAIDLSGLFISHGPVVQRRSGIGTINIEYDRDPSVSYSGPLLLLQNRYSASASEIFAGAIQDYGRGLIVGEQSFGKGTVQQLVDLDRFLLSPKMASNKSGGAEGQEEKERYGQLKLTTEKFYRITGNSTQRKGVMPDVFLPTPWESDNSGENSRPAALPYDEIAKSDFEPTDEITPEIKTGISESFKTRLKTDEDLKVLLEEIEIYKGELEQKELSLNYNKRLKEKDKNEGQRKMINKLGKVKDDGETNDDLYLKQTEKILIDLIGFERKSRK